MNEKQPNKMSKEETIKHYQTFAEMQPLVFIRATYGDLVGFARGEDGNGVIFDGLAPDLGEKVWTEVVKALSSTYSRACDDVAFNRLISKENKKVDK